MKITIITLSLLSIFAANASDLKNNYCRPLIDSKKYLTSNFSANYPKIVKYECSYECQVNNKITVVAGISNVTVTSINDDAQNVVCQGVKVKQVSWGYDFDGIANFYAFDASTPEVKEFAFENIDQKRNTIPEEIEHLNKLKKDIYTVAGAYAQAGASSGEMGRGFSEAANTLTQIANQLPQKTTLLDQAIKQIVVNKGRVGADAKAQSLVDRVIMSAASWRIPTYQF